MKKIIIDAYPVATPYVGLGEYCRRLGEGLNEHAEELRSEHKTEISFFVPPKFKGCFGDKVGYIEVAPSFRRMARFLPVKADLYHVPYQYSRIKYMYFAKKTLLTIHDINFMYEKKGDELDRSIRKFKERVAHADYVNYISNFACEDTEKHFSIGLPKKIIYNGVADFPAMALHNATLPNNLPSDFMFHISSLRAKKNIHLLVEMMKYLPEQNLVIAGDWSGAYGEGLLKKIKEEHISNIYTLPNVSETEKIALYASCRAFLFPSLCEGFGLPPIEAMKFGKPVFLSTLTSLPEIGGRDAFYWDDLSPKVMADVVKAKLADFDANPSVYAEKMKQNANRFNWNRCVEQYIEYYLEILKS